MTPTTKMALPKITPGINHCMEPSCVVVVVFVVSMAVVVVVVLVVHCHGLYL